MVTEETKLSYYQQNRDKVSSRVKEFYEKKEEKKEYARNRYNNMCD